MTATTANQHRYWTDDDDALLGTVTDEAAALVIGRTVTAVTRRRRELGIRKLADRRGKSVSFTADMDAVIAAYTTAQAARMLGVGRKAIATRRRELELSPFDGKLPKKRCFSCRRMFQRRRRQQQFCSRPCAARGRKRLGRSRSWATELRRLKDAARATADSCELCECPKRPRFQVVELPARVWRPVEGEVSLFVFCPACAYAVRVAVDAALKTATTFRLDYSDPGGDFAVSIGLIAALEFKEAA